MEKTRQSYIYAGLAVFFWATVPTAFKICLGELPIIQMLTIASLVSATILFTVLWLTGKLNLISKGTGKDFINSAILGFINPFLYYLILLKAYQLLPAQVAQPLNMIWPIILVFLSVPLLRQNIRTKSYLALLISFAGVYLISSQGDPLHPGHSDTVGVVLATGSSVFWAFYFILNIKDKRDEAVKLFLNFLFGSVYLVSALLITDQWPDSFSAKGILSAVYIGIFEMGITFYFWLRALQLAATTDKVSNLVYLAPFLSLVFVHFIIHEPIFYTTLAGLLLIISGIFIQNRNFRKRINC
ncbi:MAG: DMT family transporter [Bacteroidales bacterium]|nr:DMT family transporter [Bacteroidales bacterium]